MLIEEEPKIVGEVNPDALEGVFDEIIVEEETIIFSSGDNDDDDELDIPFTDDEGHW